MKGMVVIIMIAVIIMIEGICVGDGDSKVDLDDLDGGVVNYVDCVDTNSDNDTKCGDGDRKVDCGNDLNGGCGSYDYSELMIIIILTLILIMMLIVVMTSAKLIAVKMQLLLEIKLLWWM